eukprot:scaffold11571_cov119-Isochrysis_galbana.AAC.10
MTKIAQARAQTTHNRVLHPWHALRAVLTRLGDHAAGVGGRRRRANPRQLRPDAWGRGGCMLCAQWPPGGPPPWLPPTKPARGGGCDRCMCASRTARVNQSTQLQTANVAEPPLVSQ